MIVLGLAAHLLETMPYVDFAPRKGSDRLLDALGIRRKAPLGGPPSDFQSL
jgi:hypothetical protein